MRGQLVDLRVEGMAMFSKGLRFEEVCTAFHKLKDYQYFRALTLSIIINLSDD